MADSSPFLSRRSSRYESLVSAYEAAVEVVRTHADTDVQLQPADQPIAEEEPQLLQRPSMLYEDGTVTEAEIEPAGMLPQRTHRQSMGGVSNVAAASGALSSSMAAAAGAAPLSPIQLFLRKAESAHGAGQASGSAPSSPTGQVSPVAASGAAADAPESQGEEDVSVRAGQAGAASLLTMAAMGGPFAAAPAQAARHGRSHRKQRSEKPKKAALMSNNWLKIDYKGVDNIIRVDRHKLMHKLGVQARDLRLLDQTSTTPPAILDRDKAIIVNLPVSSVKCVITLDYVLVVNSLEGEGGEPVAAFVSELKAKLSNPRDNPLAATAGDARGGPPGRAPNGSAPRYVGLSGAASQVSAVTGYSSLNLPFELKVLEVCLDTTAAQLDEATRALEHEAYPTLDALTQAVSSTGLEDARRIKNRLVRLTKQVESVREVLQRFLDDDGDMHRLHLTGAELSRQVSLRPAELARTSAGLAGSSVADSDSSSDSSIDEAETAAVEMLLEAYFMQVDNTFNRLQTVHEYIKDTEDLVTIQLDQHRNQLITIDLVLTSFTTCLAAMTVVGGYFGMNLTSGLKEAGGVFLEVVIATTAGGMALYVAFLYFLHKQKLLYY